MTLQLMWTCTTRILVVKVGIIRKIECGKSWTCEVIFSKKNFIFSIFISIKCYDTRKVKNLQKKFLFKDYYLVIHILYVIYEKGKNQNKYPIHTRFDKVVRN